MLTHTPLMPAKAGIEFLAKALGPRFRGDERERTSTQLSWEPLWWISARDRPCIQPARGGSRRPCAVRAAWRCGADL